MHARSAGDGAVLLYFHDLPPDDRHVHAHALMRALDASCVPGVLDCVSGRHSLLVRFDPLLTSAGEVVSFCSSIDIGHQSGPDARRIEVPVLYDGEDLSLVAELAGLDAAGVVRLHSSREYTVYFTGFMPGFPYLGPLPERLRLPRLDTPRTRVPSGSVAIAEELTAIYPASSPGGWRLLGRTPLVLFDVERRPPALLAPGDVVRFRPITPGQYERLRAGAEPPKGAE